MEFSGALRGYVSITLASVLWGTMGVLAKLAYGFGIAPLTLIALRHVFSFGLLFLVLLLFNRGSMRIRRGDLLLFVVFGVFATAFQRIAFFYAVDLTTATMAALLFYTYPVFVTVTASFLLKEKITGRIVSAIVLAFSGVALVVKAYDVSALKVNIVGIVFGLLSSLLFVVYFFVAKKLRREYANWTLTLFGDGIGALMLLPVVFVGFPSIVVFPLELWILILVIAWVPSLLAYLLYSYSLKFVRASKGTILGVMEPLTAAVLSTIFLGENFELLQIVGMALALTGVVLLFLEKIRTEINKKTNPNAKGNR